MVNPFIIKQSFSKMDLLDNGRSCSSIRYRKLEEMPMDIKSCNLSNRDVIKEFIPIINKYGTNCIGYIEKCYANKRDYDAGTLESMLIHLSSLEGVM